MRKRFQTPPRFTEICEHTTHTESGQKSIISPILIVFCVLLHCVFAIPHKASMIISPNTSFKINFSEKEKKKNIVPEIKKFGFLHTNILYLIDWPLKSSSFYTSGTIRCWSSMDFQCLMEDVNLSLSSCKDNTKIILLCSVVCFHTENVVFWRILLVKCSWSSLHMPHYLKLAKKGLLKC